jgi:hypothetical protein
MVRIAAPAGYGFCSACGGLFKLDKDKALPSHSAVGHEHRLCEGGSAVPEGVGVRSQSED